MAAALGLPGEAIAIDITVAEELESGDLEDSDSTTDDLDLESLNDLETTLEHLQNRMPMLDDRQLDESETEDEIDDEETDEDLDEDGDLDEDETRSHSDLRYPPSVIAPPNNESEGSQRRTSASKRSSADRRKSNQRRGMTEADARELQAILAQVAAAITAKQPKTPIDRLTTWQETLERGIQDKLRLASYKTNQALQRFTLIPEQVPERALEAAARVDNEANSPVAHVVQMLVETSGGADNRRRIQEQRHHCPQVPPSSCM